MVAFSSREGSISAKDGEALVWVVALVVDTIGA